MAESWRIITQRQTSELTADGRFQEVMEVTVEVATGTVIQIQIPISIYNAETVKELVEARVADILEVEQL